MKLDHLLRTVDVQQSGGFRNDDTRYAEALTASPFAVDPDRQDVSELAQRLVQGFWRRRHMILIPMLVLLPIVLFAAKTMPLTFVSRSLLLIDEPRAPNDTIRQENLNQRQAGFEALLKSDQILLKVASDLHLSPAALEGLRGRLSITLLGPQFLELRLRGDDPRDLGLQLEKVTTHFLESLLGTEPELTAGQFLIRMRRADLGLAQQKLATLEAQLRATLPDGLTATARNLRALELQIEARTQELSGIERLLEQRSHKREEAASGTTAGGSNLPVPAAATNSVGSEPTVRSLTEQRAQLNDTIAHLNNSARALRQAIGNNLRLQKAVSSASGELAIAQSQLDSSVQRYGTMDARSNLLSTPALIKVVDPPTDPQFPTSSRMIYAMIGLASSAAIGLLLAWIAESLDQRLRHPREFAQISGLPVITSLPKFSRPSSGRHGRIASILVLFAILFASALGILLAQNKELRDNLAAQLNLVGIGQTFDQAVAKFLY